MVLNSAKELGKTIASQQKQIDSLKQEVSPNDPSASFPLFAQERVAIVMTVVGRKRIYDTTSFIVDHLTLGDVDSSILNIDGGYIASTYDDEFPLTFPISFGVSESGDIIINGTF